MRTRIVLFLLSSIIVFGCVQQAERPQPRKVPAQGAPCTDANPCVTVHDVILDGDCPDILRLGSRDVVKFANQSGRKVLVFDLDNPSSNAPADLKGAAVHLSEKKHIPLWVNDTLGYLQVNKNPSSDSLDFEYSIRYTGPDGKLCGSKLNAADSVFMGFMPLTNPPRMIVGPDTL